MSGKLTKSGFSQLIEGDISWLLKQPKTLERDHIEALLNESVSKYYPTPEQLIATEAVLDQVEEALREAIVGCGFEYNTDGIEDNIEKALSSIKQLRCEK